MVSPFIIAVARGSELSYCSTVFTVLVLPDYFWHKNDHNKSESWMAKAT
jgi:hypothetical protein